MTTDRDRVEATRHLHIAFNLLAPTGIEQAALVKQIGQSTRDVTIELQIAMAIVDGLKFGNWPK